MVRGRLALAPLFLALAVGQAHAKDTDQDPREALQSLLTRALRITISARVLPADEKPIWNAESTKLTLPGRPIRVRLDGDNVRIHLVCTPYVQDDGEVLLLAQGEVWFSPLEDREVKYSSAFYSIPVSFGEKVLFFPLGFSETEARQKDHLNMELEIKIVPYDETGRPVSPAPTAQPAQQN
ncbi:MAG TPA: hypothetical protein VMV03_17915 [Spirochaetia bacterium]|nr:hypothetical protein [Spirochaetia bacterium]